MISLVSINQSGHNIYQKKAEYVSYRRVSSILFLVKGLEKYVLKNTKNPIFSCHFFGISIAHVILKIENLNVLCLFLA